MELVKYQKNNSLPRTGGVCVCVCAGFNLMTLGSLAAPAPKNIFPVFSKEEYIFGTGNLQSSKSTHCSFFGAAGENFWCLRCAEPSTNVFF